MSDSFKTEYDNIRKLITGVNQDIGKRQQFKNEGKQTALIDGEIRAQLNSIEKQLEMYNKQIIRYQNEPLAYGITQKEAERRKNLYGDLLNLKQQAKSKYDQQNEAFQQPKRIIQFDKQTQNFEKKYDSDGQTSNEQLYQAQQKEKQLQEDQIDLLIGTVGNIKHIGKAIGNELDEQDVILDELDSGIDKNISSMEKGKKNMTKLMENTSKCCLITTITVELASLILMLVFL